VPIFHPEGHAFGGEKFHARPDVKNMDIMFIGESDQQCPIERYGVCSTVSQKNERRLGRWGIAEVKGHIRAITQQRLISVRGKPLYFRFDFDIPGNKKTRVER
jgi:hypothetical protein